MNELALFFGGGGGLLGSFLVGHRIVCGVEIDPYCREVIMRRQEEGHIPAFPIWDDASTFDGKHWRGVVDIITAGFPCQPWSLAGKRKGISDERNLWPDTFRIIQEARPGYVMLENVPGIGKYLPVVIADLRRAQYTVERPVIIAAAAVGAGHIRKRVWIFAYDNNKRELQQEGIVSQFGERDCNGIGAAPIFADNIGLRQRNECRRRTGQKGQDSAIGENATEKGISSNDRSARSQGLRREHGLCKSPSKKQAERVFWWNREPGLARLVHRPSNRVERIRITGNIQVPAVVRRAWDEFTGTTRAGRVAAGE